MPPRVNCHRMLAVVAAAALFGSHARSAVADSDRLSLEELRAAVAEQYSSIQSLYVAHAFARPESAGGKTEQSVWAEQGTKVLFRTEYTNDTVGFWLSYDGTRSYNLGYDDNRQPAQVELRETAPDLAVTCYFSKVLGWYVGQGKGSVVDALSGDALLKESDDDSLYVVSVQGFVSRPNPTPMNVTIHLDSSHDFLPRRVELSDVANPSWKFTYAVDEFGRVSDEENHRERWFPMKGRYIQDTPQRGVEEFTLTATEVRINASLPDSVFVPEMPKGMSVIDNSQKGHQRFYVVGGYSSTDEHLQQLAEEARGAMSQRNRILLVVVLNTCGALVIALLLYLTRRGKKKSP